MNAYINIRITLIVIALLLALFGVSNAFVAVFYRADYELTWNYDVVVRYCTEGQCAYSALLEIANTGHEAQPRVTLRVQGIPGELGGTPRIMNLDSSEPRSGDPVITQAFENGVNTIVLADFSAGTLVHIMIQGVVPEADMGDADKVEVSIESRGRQIEADPRGIAFGRWFG